MSLEFPLVGLPGNPTYSSVEALLEAAAAFGLTYTGLETAKHLNQELQGLPKFKELAGPMGNGKSPQGTTRIRYETWEVNEIYSR